jgi:hypothetical protein
MTRSQALKIVKSEGVEIFPSVKKGFVFFVPAEKDELPYGVSVKDNEDGQMFGTHLTTKELIRWAETLPPVCPY